MSFSSLPFVRFVAVLFGAAATVFAAPGTAQPVSGDPQPVPIAAPTPPLSLAEAFADVERARGWSAGAPGAVVPVRDEAAPSGFGEAYVTGPRAELDRVIECPPRRVSSATGSCERSSRRCDAKSAGGSNERTPSPSTR